MTTIRVEPLDFATASDQFGTIATSALSDYSEARSSLRQYASMAGDDPGGEQFATQYDEGAKAILQAMRNLAVMTNQIDRGLTATAAIHHDAECAAAGKPTGGGFTPRPAVHEYSISAPPSAFGGKPNSTPDLWDMLKDAVGTIWPNADTDKMRQATKTWNNIASDLDALARSIRAADNSLAGNRSGEISTINSKVDELAADIAELATNAREIGDACTEYANAVDDAHAEVMKMVAQLAVEIAAGVGLSVALSFVTFGGAGAVGAAAMAARIATVAARIGGVLGRVLMMASNVAGRFALLGARIAAIAARFQKTFKISIEVVSGAGSAMFAEGVFNGKDANYLAAGLAGAGGGALTAGISTAFSTRTLSLLQKIGVESGAGAAGGGASGAIDSLIRDGKLDLTSIVLGAAMGGAAGGIGGGFDGLKGGSGGSGSGSGSGSSSAGPRVNPDPGGAPVVGGGNGGPGGSGAGGNAGGAPGGNGAPAAGGADGGASGGASSNSGGPGANNGGSNPPVGGGGSADAGPGSNSGGSGADAPADGGGSGGRPDDAPKPVTDAPLATDAPPAGDAPSSPEAPSVNDAPPANDGAAGDGSTSPDASEGSTTPGNTAPTGGQHPLPPAGAGRPDGQPGPDGDDIAPPKADDSDFADKVDDIDKGDDATPPKAEESDFADAVDDIADDAARGADDVDPTPESLDAPADGGAGPESPADSADAPVDSNSSERSLDDVDDVLSQINPRFDPDDPASDYSNNCGNTSSNLYDFLTGSPAKEAPTGTLSIAEMEARTGLPQTPMTPNDIEATLRAMGPGSHCVVGVDRAIGDGHWFNAFFDGDRVWAIDGQSGQRSGWPPHEPAATNWDASFKPDDVVRADSTPDATTAPDAAADRGGSSSVRLDDGSTHNVWASRADIAATSSADSRIDAIAQKHGLTRDQLHDLVHGTPVTALTPAQAQVLIEVRNEFPPPVPGTVLQKMYSADGALKILDGTYQPNQVSGFIAAASDTQALTDARKVFDGLGLDYTGHDFASADGKVEEVFAVRFTDDAVGPMLSLQDPIAPLEVQAGANPGYVVSGMGPLGSGNPYLGNGFVGKGQDALIPEYHQPGFVPAYRDGAEMWRIGANGSEELFAVLSNGTWSLVS
ncbi:toxin glutamine deamidase domain-containing protein [Salinibacterium sp. ZJ77]|uniref:WXG100-like domain-containing protein n=1 Tax=Salinibacterium sp. ZJ77 TaxID=2708337 RepID=UPI0014203406|nr:toxin glutamine deamidase domain-containing protein [Salinibacterium sp. ZJ77]